MEKIACWIIGRTFCEMKKGKPNSGLPFFPLLRLEVRIDSAGQIALRDLHWLDW